MSYGFFSDYSPAPLAFFDKISNFKYSKTGGQPFNWDPKAHHDRSFNSFHWLFDPVRNTDPRVSYKNMPSWEWRMFGDRGHFPFPRMICNHNPSVSQYRVMMPPKSPFECAWPTAGAMTGFIIFLSKNKLFGYRWFAGALTRGGIYVAFPFWTMYYADRYLDMQGVGNYKLALDYIRHNTEKLEPTPNKRYGDADMLVPWRPGSLF